MTRQEYSIWQQSGARDISQRIRERLEGIRDNQQVPALPDRVLAAIDRIKRKAEEGEHR